MPDEAHPHAVPTGKVYARSGCTYSETSTTAVASGGQHQASATADHRTFASAETRKGGWIPPQNMHRGRRHEETPTPSVHGCNTTDADPEEDIL